jgi:hypothetical protein
VIAPVNRRIATSLAVLPRFAAKMAIMTDRQRAEKRYSEAQKVEYAREMRRRGHTLKTIGQQIGMSANGVMQMLRRVDDPQRYYGPQEDGDRPPPGEVW